MAVKEYQGGTLAKVILNNSFLVKVKNMAKRVGVC